MIISLLSFIGVLVVLCTVGILSASAIVQEKASSPLVLSLGLPLGAIVNVAVVFLLTIAHIPLRASTIIGALLLCCAAFIAMYFVLPFKEQAKVLRHHRTAHVQLIASVIILVLASIYSFSHAVLLPTFQFDSATNWTMRSEISFIDQHMAFDADERRGMAKPQYPFLFHALQITANQGQRSWNDRIANGVLWLLSVTSLLAFGLILRRRRSAGHVTTIVALLAAIPLFMVHLAQGYGDIVLAQWMILSLASMIIGIEEENHAMLMLSAIFVAACVWTKSEGFIVALIPWLLVILFFTTQRMMSKRNAMKICSVAVLLSIPWPVFAVLSGLALTPHTGDATLACNAAAIRDVLPALLARGSFGIGFWIVPAFMGILSYRAWKHDPQIDRRAFITLLWGIIAFVIISFTYTCTPNAQFLLNGESFYRQMLLPLSLLIVSAWMTVKDA